MFSILEPYDTISLRGEQIASGKGDNWTEGKKLENKCNILNHYILNLFLKRGLTDIFIFGTIFVGYETNMKKLDESAPTQSIYTQKNYF